MVLRSGDRMEVVQGVHQSKTTQCGIIDHGLPGLQHAFVSLKHGAVADPSFNWGLTKRPAQFPTVLGTSVFCEDMDPTGEAITLL